MKGMITSSKCTIKHLALPELAGGAHSAPQTRSWIYRWCLQRGKRVRGKERKVVLGSKGREGGTPTIFPNRSSPLLTAVLLKVGSRNLHIALS